MKRSYAFPGNRKSGFCSLPIHPQILPQLTNILSIFDDFSTRECQGVPLQKSRGCSFHKQKWALRNSTSSLYFPRSSGTFSRVAPVQPIILQVNDRRRFLVDNIDMLHFFYPPDMFGVEQP